MKKLVIAYHTYLYGNNYMTMINDQFRQLIWSKLFENCSKLYIGVVDSSTKKPEWGVGWIKKYFNFSSSKKDEVDPRVEVVVYPSNDELRGTLHWIRDYAKNNPNDYILFLHTKGITHGINPAIEDWRKYMEYFVIEKWRRCIHKLDEGYDCCGVLWNADTPVGMYPHFSGAFYWAKASYINTLNHDYIDSAWRYHMEFWIGSNPNAKVFEFHNSGYNTTERLIAQQGHYNVRYSRSNYAKH